MLKLFKEAATLMSRGRFDLRIDLWYHVSTPYLSLYSFVRYDLKRHKTYMFSKIDATNPLCKYLPLRCVKSVQIRSYFWSVFSCIRIEYGPEITPYLDTFHAVLVLLNFFGKLKVLLLFYTAFQQWLSSGIFCASY